MADIKLVGVNKIYSNGVHAVSDFNLEIHDKEFVVFVGPSGCGKSTTLRMIAGLEDITSGELYIDGKLVNKVHPRDRDIAMVFQNYALYPYMTVFDNMAFGLKLRKVPKGEIRQKVEAAADILGLKQYLDSKPSELSGGQRQRVALGRAIVREPKVFLLDEPLSNLDAKMRATMRTEIIRIHQRLQTTFVYVTHDQTEAMTMGQRIVVMKDGRIQQVDTPDNLYLYPVNKFVAGFIGTPQMNFIDVMLEVEEGTTYAGFSRYRIPLPKKLVERFKITDYNKRQVTLGIRPEDVVEEAYEETNDHSKMAGTIKVYEKLGNETLVYLDVLGLSNEIISRSGPRFSGAIEDKVGFHFNTEFIQVFDYDTGESLLKK
jgi:multiple sugar transport system ATP-binding protein